MALEDSIKAVRDYVVDAVVASWPGVTVTHEDPRQSNILPVAWVRTDPPVFDPLTCRSDEATVSVTVVGRFAELTDSERIDKASQLRTELLTLTGLNGVAYRTEAREFEGFNEADMLDPRTEVGVVFMCKVRAARS